MMWDVLIVGGGAAGLAAACSLSPRARVLVAEKQKRVGRKLLSTGNGRCNLTNLHAAPARYHGEEAFIAEALAHYAPEQVRTFFAELGLPTRAEEDGRVYPASNQAASVLDVLRFSAEERGTRFETECDVVRLRAVGDGFRAEARDGRAFSARSVLICCGGPAAPSLGGCGDGARLLKTFGHAIVPEAPALTPLRVSPDSVRALKGQRLFCTLTLYEEDCTVRTEAGELLFGDGTLSGIAAMGLARDAGRALQRRAACVVGVSILPGPVEEIADMLHARSRSHPARKLEDFLTGIVSKRIGMELIRRAGLRQSELASSLGRQELAALAELLVCWRFPVEGVQGFEHAQVASGGAVLAQFDPRTMSSRRQKGLFAAGETLAVDGDCGGYNLHWAWVTALTAADGIRAYLRKTEGGRA